MIDNFYIVRMPNPTIELVKTIVREDMYLDPFDYCKLDVTDKYFKVSNLEIPSKNPVKNAEDYAYIFCFKNWHFFTAPL